MDLGIHHTDISIRVDNTHKDWSSFILNIEFNHRVSLIVWCWAILILGSSSRIALSNGYMWSSNSSKSLSSDNFNGQLTCKWILTASISFLHVIKTNLLLFKISILLNDLLDKLHFFWN